jgi:hypothetical protein
VSVASSVNAASKSALQALVDEVHRVVKLPQFKRHVAAYQGQDLLKTSTTGAFADGQTVLAAYLGQLETTHPLPVVLFDDAPRDSVVTAVTSIHVADARVRGDYTHAETHLSPVVLERWLRGGTKSRACAVNTLAHELTHTVVDASASMVFLDGGYTWMWLTGGRHVVSYTVGTVAQCTVLEEAGQPYEACVAEAGTTAFSPTGCDSE